MSIKPQIVVAQDEGGHTALLYLGSDAEEAMRVVGDDEALEKSGLSGRVTIEFYRKPIHFKRRTVEKVEKKTLEKSKKKGD